MAREVVFRTDASVGIGGGHVIRCLALAAAMAAAGWRCRFVVGSETVQAVPALIACGHDVVTLCRPQTEENCELRRALPHGGEVLVVDHYQRGAEFERAAREWAR